MLLSLLLATLFTLYQSSGVNFPQNEIAARLPIRPGIQMLWDAALVTCYWDETGFYSQCWQSGQQPPMPVTCDWSVRDKTLGPATLWYASCVQTVRGGITHFSCEIDIYVGWATWRCRSTYFGTTWEGAWSG